MADRTARVLIGVDTDAAEAASEFGKLATSVDGVETQLGQLEAQAASSQADAMPDSLRLAFDRAEMAANNFQQRLETGAVTGPRDLRKVAIAQTLLNLEIEKSGKEIKDLGPAAQAAYAKLEKAQKDAIVTTSRIAAELDDVNVQTKTGVTGFTGFGNAIEAMGGKAAVAAESMGFVAAAFAAGLAAGQQFNQFAKTDMSEWNDQVELLGLRFKNTFAGIADVLVSYGTLATAIFSGDMVGIKQAMTDFDEGWKKTKDSLFASNDKLRKTRDELKAAEEAAKAAAAATDQKKVADDKAAEAAKKYAEEQKRQVALYLEQEKKARDAAIAAEVLAQEIRNETTAVDAAAVAYDTATEVLGRSEQQVEILTITTTGLSAALEEAQIRAAKMSEEYGANSSAAKNAAGDVKDLEDRLANAQQATDLATQSVDENRQRQDEAAAAVEQHTKRLDDLKSGQEKVTVTADAAAEASKRLGAASTDAGIHIAEWSSAASKAQGSMSTLAAAAAQAERPILGIGKGMTDYAVAMREADSLQNRAIANLSAINTELVKMVANANLAGGELKKLGEVK